MRLLKSWLKDTTSNKKMATECKSCGRELLEKIKKKHTTLTCYHCGVTKVKGNMDLSAFYSGGAK
jgi:predicted RNA-binding Zn-ribbon protein involved in translation (DUF1610 family)